MPADPPRTLPAGLTSLSVSSVGLFMRDPYKWRRRYIDHDYEPVSPALIVGHATGRAEGESYQQQITDGHRYLLGQLHDSYHDHFELKADTSPAGVDWNGERPGRVKDRGYQALVQYHRDVAPHVEPLSVERRFEIGLPYVDWTFTGYLDLEAVVRREVGVDDFKSRSHTKGPVSASEADGELQPTGYLFALREEIRSGVHPVRWRRSSPVFRYHSLVLPRVGKARPRDVAVTPTARTDEQLDTFLALLYSVAAEIDWRVENDVWRGARADDPLCSPRWCGFWASCPYGGAHRPPPTRGPQPARRPTPDQVLDAVAETARRDKTTTAARVGAHLGVSTRSAATSLAALARHGQIRSALPAKRRKGAPKVHVYHVIDDVSRPLERSLQAAATNGSPRQEALL